MAEREGEGKPAYDEVKQFGGRAYTGMRVGGTHHWIYPEGHWDERKVTPDKWEFRFRSSKQRKAKAPEGSGAPVGTEYHWYLLGHQRVRKVDANTYDTLFEGSKFKLAHKRAGAGEWSTWSALHGTLSQRRKLLRILEEEAQQLRLEIEAEERERAARKEGVEVEARGRPRAPRLPKAQRRLPGLPPAKGEAGEREAR